MAAAALGEALTRFSGSLDFSASPVHSPVGWSSGEGFINSSGSPAFEIVSSARLDNRDELIVDLGETRLQAASDSLILLFAYSKWGSECASRLLGEFSFAIWDPSRETLFCCRDHLALRPFFYWHSVTRFEFADDPSPILRRPGVPRKLNRDKLSDMAVNGGRHFRHEETFHAGLLSLPGGSCMTVSRAGIRKWSYWDPRSSRISVPKCETEFFESLRDLLFAAVGARLRESRSPAALLSGGLDSSSLVAIAARILEKQNRGLVTLSAVLPQSGFAGLTDEREYMEEFRSFPNVRMEYITAPSRGPFDHVGDDRYFESSFGWTSRHYLPEAFQERASSLGLDVILDGFGGELGPTCWPFDYYFELAVNLKWATLTKELTALYRLRGVNPFRMLGSDMLNCIAPSRRFTPLIFFHPEFARESRIQPNFRRRWPDQRKTQLEALEQYRARHANADFSGERGFVPFSMPLLDKRLVEFCIAAPSRLKVRNGTQRYLIRRALDRILPAKIQWRKDKKPFSCDYNVRYNAQLPKAQEYVAAIRPTDPVGAIVDLPRLRGALKPVDPAASDWAALTSIPATIYLIAFLRQFAEFRP